MAQVRALKWPGVKSWIPVAALIVGAATLWRPTPAEAHCDSTNGPVVTAARVALTSGDPSPILAYVQPDAERELSAAFWQTLEVRKAGGQTQELADRYFYETAVRLHRNGEGAAYTGLTEVADFGPALTAAERALDTGDLPAVVALLERTTHEGLEQRYHAVVEARERAARDGSLAAARERAEAELGFQKYVDELYKAAAGLTPHEEGATAHAEAH